MPSERSRDDEDGNKVVRVLDALWSSSGLIWGITVGVLSATIWGMTTLSSVTTAIELLANEKVNADQVRAIFDREGSVVRDTINANREGYTSLSERLHRIEIQLARFAAIMERKADGDKQGFAPKRRANPTISSATKP